MVSKGMDRTISPLREIPGCKGLYSVTKDGRVWSSARSWTAGKGSQQQHDGRWLKPVIDATGYMRVRLTIEGSRSFPSVHRLVALTWIANPRGLPEVNHIDGDKQNNTDENLEWCTSAENHQHAKMTGLYGPHSRRKLSPGDAALLRERRSNGETVTDLARSFSIDRKTVYAIVAGRTYRA